MFCQDMWSPRSECGTSERHETHIATDSFIIFKRNDDYDLPNKVMLSELCLRHLEISDRYEIHLTKFYYTNLFRFNF